MGQALIRAYVRAQDARGQTGRLPPKGFARNNKFG